MKRKTTVMLFRFGPAWNLATYKGDNIPRLTLPTRAAARAHAKSKGWRVRRADCCDDLNP